MIHYANKGDGNIQIKSWNDTRLKIVPFRGQKKKGKKASWDSVSVSSGNSCMCVLDKQKRLLSKGVFVLQALQGAHCSSWSVVK